MTPEIKDQFVANMSQMLGREIDDSDDYLLDISRVLINQQELIWKLEGRIEYLANKINTIQGLSEY